MKNRITLIVLLCVIGIVLVSCNQNTEVPSSQSKIPSWAIGSWASSDDMFKATISSNEVVLTINDTNTFYLMEHMKNGQGKMTITSDSFTIDVYYGDGTSYYKFSIKDSSALVLTIHSLGSESSVVLFNSNNTNNSSNSGNSNSGSSEARTWKGTNTSFGYKLVLNSDKKTGSVTIPEGTFAGTVMYTSMIYDMGGYQIKRYCVIFDFDETDDFFSIEKENSDGTFSDFNSVDEVWDQQKVVLRGYETIKMNRV